MLERFTESAKGVLAEAQDLALELGSPFIIPGHLLYGCAEARDELGDLLLVDQILNHWYLHRW